MENIINKLKEIQKVKGGMQPCFILVFKVGKEVKTIHLDMAFKSRSKEEDFKINILALLETCKVLNKSKTTKILGLYTILSGKGAS